MVKQRRALVIGASVAGLVAAAQLRADGWAVTLVEKGQAVGGLFSQVETPFGPCELGMHVLYVSAQHQALLEGLFGAEAFIVRTGVETDIGAAFHGGRLNLDSIYPDLRQAPEQALMLAQLLEQRGTQHPHTTEFKNAASASVARFGELVTEQAIAPILQKLWKSPVAALAPGALHCFFDLRRIILADKPQSDSLKRDPALDEVIGNPLQRAPTGAVFGGRSALFFKSSAHDLSVRALERLRAQGIEVLLGCDVRLSAGRLMLDGRSLSEDFETCIVAGPLAAFEPALAQSLDHLELSIYYFKARPLPLPAYYILCQDPALVSSRIVNYGAYNFERIAHLDELFAVEVLHEPSRAPAIEQIRAELCGVLPALEVVDAYALPRRLRIAGPTLANATRLDELAASLNAHAGFAAIFFAGMRTDQGMFFSHQTIGAAHAAALDCSRRLP